MMITAEEVKQAESIAALHCPEGERPVRYWEAFAVAINYRRPSDGGVNTTIPVQAGRSDAEMLLEEVAQYLEAGRHPDPENPWNVKARLVREAARALSRGGR